MPKTRHVIFAQSIAPDLRKALALAGRDDEVVCCPDDFRMGPLAPADPERRIQWAAEVLGADFENFADDVEAFSTFWREALSPDHHLIAWTSNRVARERAGFLEWLWRLGDRPCEILDLSTAQLRRYPAILGLLEVEDFLSMSLFDAATPLSPADRARHHQTWRRLRDENAPLRIIRDGELASASIEVFDQKLLSYTPSRWTPAARVVGGVLTEAFDDYLFQVGDLVLSARLWALAQTGAIEMRAPPHTGKRPPLKGQEIRRPSKSQARALSRRDG